MASTKNLFDMYAPGVDEIWYRSAAMDDLSFTCTRCRKCRPVGLTYRDVVECWTSLCYCRSTTRCTHISRRTATWKNS